ncbi:FAD-binding oxidoreductase [Brevundimonas intermedia]|uniref:FAD-binding oxidoreductase n=2 Tax=Brevundimonas intermedia TaxID=74315 RepID=A0A4Y9S741_9CAUL|nr:FAD-binding oxidoreductase [Brevundimonas intermedia]
MEYDYIVFGGGMAGASVAYELSADARVCLIEREASVGYHATGRSAALFAPSYGGREVRGLTRASHDFFMAPPEGFTHAPLLTRRSAMYIARENQGGALDVMVAEIRRSGGVIDRLTMADALQAVPLLRADYVAGAAIDHDAHDIDVDALHQGFLRGARARGAQIMTGAGDPTVSRRDAVWRVDLATGPVSAPVAINAAGAWGDRVATAFGAQPIGLTPLRRTAVLVDPPFGVDIMGWPAVIDVDETFYFKPDAGKLLISPADETLVEPCDVQPEELDIAIGVDRVQAALRLDVERVNHSWAGLRTFAPDRAPVIGFDPEIDGLFWSVGQGGYGIQTAPAWARTAAALAQGRPLPADIAAEGLDPAHVSPSRFRAEQPSLQRLAQ